MKSGELALMGRFRQALRFCVRGRGVAASVVAAFRDSDAIGERAMVRKIMLGQPVSRAVQALPQGRDSTSSTRDLMLYVVEQAKVDAAEASRRADRLTVLFEHWIWMTRQREMDQKVMETRSILVSAVLGGVTAMISSLAPLLAGFHLSLTLTQTPPSQPPFSGYLGILFVIPAASFLGVYFSRKRAYLNVIVACGAYLAVSYFFGPLVQNV